MKNGWRWGRLGSVLWLGCGVSIYASACGSSGGGGAGAVPNADASAGGDDAASGSNGQSSGAGQPDSASPVFNTDSAAPAKLSARILPVKCNGTCADIKVDVQGGNPPYHIQWEDGSTSVDREVCSVPDGGNVSVQVKDTANPDQEIPMPQQTATDQVAGSELDCTPPEDAGAGCQVLLSSALFGGADAAPYSACDDAGQSLTFALAQPMLAGHSYTVAFDLVFPVLIGNEPSLEVWGASEACGYGQSLGKLTFDGTSRLAFCAQANADYSSLTFHTEVPDGSVFILALTLQETLSVCGGCSGDP